MSDFLRAVLKYDPDQPRDERGRWVDWVNTPEFKAWFSGSTVANRDGTPKAVYHSTNTDFSEFKPASHFGTSKAAQDRVDTTLDFSVNVVRRNPGAYQVMPVYLNLKNPLRMKDQVLIREPYEVEEDDGTKMTVIPRNWEDPESVALTLLDTGVISIDEYDSGSMDTAPGVSWDNIIKLLRSKGYDGIVYENAVEDAGQDSYIIFSPEQVKSVFNPRPTSHPDISKRDTDGTQPRDERGRWVDVEGWASIPEVLASLEDVGAEQHRLYLSPVKRLLDHVGLSQKERDKLFNYAHLQTGITVEPGQPVNVLGYCVDMGVNSPMTRRFLVAFNDKVLDDKRVLKAMPGIREFVFAHEIGHALLMIHNIPEKNAGNLPVGITEINDAMRTLKSESQSLAEKGVPPEHNRALKALDHLEYLKLIYNREGGVHEYFADAYAYLRGAPTIRGVPRKAYEQIFPTTIRVVTKIMKETFPDFVPAVRFKVVSDSFAAEYGNPPEDVSKADTMLSSIPGWWDGYSMDEKDSLVELSVKKRDTDGTQPRDDRGRWVDEDGNPEEEEEQLAPLEAALKEYGTTEDIREAGYITPDGDMLDFSGKREGGSPGVRAYDHRQVAEDMWDWMAETGCIRVHGADDGTVMASVNGLPSQRALKRLVEETRGDLIVEVHDAWNYHMDRDRTFTEPMVDEVSEYIEETVAEIRRRKWTMEHGGKIGKSWLGVIKEWAEELHPRGKTSPESTPGSFAPRLTGQRDVLIERYEFRRPNIRSTEKVGVIFNPSREELRRWAGRDVKNIRYIKWGSNVVFWNAYEALHAQIGAALRKDGHITEANYKEVADAYDYGNMVRGEDFEVGDTPLQELLRTDEQRERLGLMSYDHLFSVKKSWVQRFLQVVKDAADWQESAHPRGKTTPGSNSGSFRPADEVHTDMLGPDEPQRDWVGHTTAELSEMARNAAFQQAMSDFTTWRAELDARDSPPTEMELPLLTKYADRVASMMAQDLIRQALESGELKIPDNIKHVTPIPIETLKDATLAPMAEEYLTTAIRDALLQESAWDIELAEDVRQDLAYGDRKLMDDNLRWGQALDNYIGNHYDEINGVLRGESVNTEPDPQSDEWQTDYQWYIDQNEESVMRDAMDSYMENVSEQLSDQLGQALADDDEMTKLQTLLEEGGITQEEYEEQRQSREDAIRESIEEDARMNFDTSTEYEEAMQTLKSDAEAHANEVWAESDHGEEYLEEAEAIQELIDSRPPTPLPLILYRGLKSGYSIGWPDLAPGDEIDLAGFSSSSSKYSVGGSWGSGRRVLEIVVPAGAKDVFFTTNDREGEVILNHGTKLTVLSKNDDRVVAYFHPEGNEPQSVEGDYKPAYLDMVDSLPPSAHGALHKGEGRRFCVNLGKLDAEPMVVADPGKVPVRKEWQDEDHPRGKTTEGTNAGSFKPRGGVAFVSPSVDEHLSFDEARGRMASDRTRLLKKAGEEIDQFFSVGGYVQAGLGAWSDGAEQSLVYQYGTSDYDRVKAAACLKGLIAEQKAVVPFVIDEDGPSAMFRFKVAGQNIREVHDKLLEAGVQFHTLVPSPDGIYIYAFEESHTDEFANTVERAAEALSATDRNYWRGRGEIFGSWDSREEGRAKYEEFLRAYSERVYGSDEGWRQLRDHWLPRLQGVRKSWLQVIKDWSEEQHPRWPSDTPWAAEGPGPGRFAPADGGGAAASSGPVWQAEVQRWRSSMPPDTAMQSLASLLHAEGAQKMGVLKDFPQEVFETIEQGLSSANLPDTTLQQVRSMAFAVTDPPKQEGTVAAFDMIHKNLAFTEAVFSADKQEFVRSLIHELGHAADFRHIPQMTEDQVAGTDCNELWAKYAESRDPRFAFAMSPEQAALLKAKFVEVTASGKPMNQKEFVGFLRTVYKDAAVGEVAKEAVKALISGLSHPIPKDPMKQMEMILSGKANEYALGAALMYPLATHLQHIGEGRWKPEDFLPRTSGEVFAQMHAFYYTHRDTMKKVMPKAYAYFTEFDKKLRSESHVQKDAAVGPGHPAAAGLSGPVWLSAVLRASQSSGVDAEAARGAGEGRTHRWLRRLQGSHRDALGVAKDWDESRHPRGKTTPESNAGSFAPSGEATGTPEFKAWFSGSKVVDDDGEPLRVYHGTTADFSVFQREKANPEADWGAGYYFTNTMEDVEHNYAGIGPDLKQKIELEAERIAQETDREYDDPAVVEEARAKYVEHEGATLPVYLKMENPLRLGGDNPTYWELNFDEESGEESGTLLELHKALHWVAHEFHDFDPQKAFSEALEKVGTEGTAGDYLAALKESEGMIYATDDEGRLVSGEILRRTLEYMDFDGIIDATVDVKFGSQRKMGQSMRGMDYDTVHYVVFNSNQVKSVFNARPTDDPDITKSWLQVIKEAVWREADHPRGKTTPGSNAGSFAPVWLDDSVRVVDLPRNELANRLGFKSPPKLEVIKNPSREGLYRFMHGAMEYVRWLYDETTGNVYAWDANAAIHTQAYMAITFAGEVVSDGGTHDNSDNPASAGGFWEQVADKYDWLSQAMNFHGKRPKILDFDEDDPPPPPPHKRPGNMDRELEKRDTDGTQPRDERGRWTDTGAQLDANAKAVEAALRERFPPTTDARSAIYMLRDGTLLGSNVLPESKAPRPDYVLTRYRGKRAYRQMHADVGEKVLAALEPMMGERSDSAPSGLEAPSQEVRVVTALMDHLGVLRLVPDTSDSINVMYLGHPSEPQIKALLAYYRSMGKPEQSWKANRSISIERVFSLRDKKIAIESSLRPPITEAFLRAYFAHPRAGDLSAKTYGLKEPDDYELVKRDTDGTQPRDDRGRWVDAGGAVSLAALRESKNKIIHADDFKGAGETPVDVLVNPDLSAIARFVGSLEGAKIARFIATEQGVLYVWDGAIAHHGHFHDWATKNNLLYNDDEPWKVRHARYLEWVKTQPTGGLYIGYMRLKAGKLQVCTSDEFDDFGAREGMAELVVKSGWLQLLKEWAEELHPRGKTTPESNAGSFSPAFVTLRTYTSAGDQNPPTRFYTNPTDATLRRLGSKVYRYLDASDGTRYVWDDPDVKHGPVGRKLRDLNLTQYDWDRDDDPHSGYLVLEDGKFVQQRYTPRSSWDRGHGALFAKHQWLAKIAKAWREEDHPRGKTTEGTNSGSFTFSEGAGTDEEFRAAMNSISPGLLDRFATEDMRTLPRPEFAYVEAMINLFASQPKWVDASADFVKQVNEWKAVREQDRQRVLVERGWDKEVPKSFSSEAEAQMYFDNALEATLRFPAAGAIGSDRSQLWGVAPIAATLKELKDSGMELPRMVDIGLWALEGLHPGMSARNTLAVYSGMDILHVNTPLFRSIADMEEACNDDSFLVASVTKTGLRGALVHELVHKQHHAVLGAEGLSSGQLNRVWLSQWNMSAASFKLTNEDFPSNYSMTGPQDFVAEVGTALYLGHPVTEKAMTLYKALHGPEIKR